MQQISFVIYKINDLITPNIFAHILAVQSYLMVALGYLLECIRVIIKKWRNPERLNHKKVSRFSILLQHYIKHTRGN